MGQDHWRPETRTPKPYATPKKLVYSQKEDTILFNQMSKLKDLSVVLLIYVFQTLSSTCMYLDF